MQSPSCSLPDWTRRHLYMYVYHTVYLKHFCVVACRHGRPDVNGQDALMTDPYVLVLRITVRSNPDTESTIGFNLVALVRSLA